MLLNLPARLGNPHLINFPPKSMARLLTPVSPSTGRDVCTLQVPIISNDAHILETSIRRPQLASLYHQYHEIQRFLHETFGLRRPLTMNEWYNDVVKYYAGAPQGFETWLWGALGIPRCILSIASYEPSAAQPNGYFACDYHGCPKEYRSKQARDNHFDVAHLGARQRCPDCGNILMNPNSLSRHQRWNCPARAQI
ncbi:hypothetical protein BT96DRAFT_984190 [Gymnopus androsaceus JB14]|uniref:C2H2-type domain-containing protein n=1 Tax=Gymnopus androsaceus JB14 TaxID=1447944 RepID=A0A6A4IJS1_9AGAR|nr:hypothetical protein BT96DRAFT_984190 [Gymnopus androsaceus JB14]